MPAEWVTDIVRRVAEASGLLQKEVLKKDRRYRSTERKANARAVLSKMLVDQGMTYKAVGQVMGCHHSSVVYYMRKIGEALQDEAINPYLADLYHKVTDSEHVPSKAFVQLCRQEGLPDPSVEFRFHPTRRWRLDYAWPDNKLALEVEGGVWIRGRHNRGAGFLKDMEKYNALAVQGWRLLRVTPSSLFSGETTDLIRKALESETAE